MKIPSYLRDALLIGLSFLALETFHAWVSKNCLAQEENLLSYRLASSIAGALNEAHRMKDDLAIYRLLDDVAKTPGIVEVKVVDRAEGLAHSYPLSQGGSIWGHLVITTSGRFAKSLLRRVGLAGFLAAVPVGLLLFYYLRRLDRQTVRSLKQVAELERLREAERLRSDQRQEREALRMRQLLASLQRALQKDPDPVVVLDTQQRVCGVAAAAMNPLGVERPEDVLGKSWHEVRALESCGTGLERSISSPGQRILWPVPGRSLTLSFETDAVGRTGTWITLSVE